MNNKVGFTAETLDFNSVVDLVDYYRNCSLEEHNPTLKTSLKFPLSFRNDSTTPTASESGIVVLNQIPKHRVSRILYVYICYTYLVHQKRE
jgi:hypothetical protein